MDCLQKERDLKKAKELQEQQKKEKRRLKKKRQREAKRQVWILYCCRNSLPEVPVLLVDCIVRSYKGDVKNKFAPTLRGVCIESKISQNLLTYVNLFFKCFNTGNFDLLNSHMSNMTNRVLLI